MFTNELPELENFLHHCSEDRATRTMAVTMYVLTHWQLAGRSLTPQVPSMLLVNGGTKRDPIDYCAMDWSDGCNSRIPSESGSGPIFVGTYEGARPDMLKTILLRSRSPTHETECIKHYAAWFEEAKNVRFGCGRVGYYAQMWDDELGWITDTTRDLILRLDRPEDHAAFRTDVFENPIRLINPVGAAQAERNIRKTLCIAGSLMADQWDSKLTEGILKLGLPILFLPHLASSPLNEGTKYELYIKAKNFSKMRGAFASIAPSLNISEDHHIGHYEHLLRKRLQNLPASYEFSVLTMAHELGEVCARIIRVMLPKERLNVQSAFYMHLHIMAFRGIVIGIHSLAYHGLGIATDCDPSEVTKLLDHLRSHGPISPRDFLRKFQKFTAPTRDQLLELLAAEGVIRYVAKKISAVPLPEFIQALHDRQEFAEPRSI